MFKKLNLKLSFLSNKKCPICLTSFFSYIKLPTFYSQKLIENNFKHDINQAETLNIKQYTCPSCGANDRDRLYKLYWQNIISNLNQTQKYNFIDFAPSQSLSKYLKNIPILNYRSADLFMNNVDDKVDIQDLPYQNDSIDFFNCSHILEHVFDDRKAISELYRILKPNGIGILMVPIMLTVTETIEDPLEKNEAIRWAKFGQDDHVRLYNKQDYINRIKSIGFKLTFLDKNSLQITDYNKNGISEKSVLYIVSK